MKKLIPVLPFSLPGDISAVRKGVYYLHQWFFKEHLLNLRTDVILTSHEHNMLENSVIGLKAKEVLSDEESVFIFSIDVFPFE